MQFMTFDFREVDRAQARWNVDSAFAGRATLLASLSAAQINHRGFRAPARGGAGDFSPFAQGCWELCDGIGRGVIATPSFISRAR